MKILGQFDTNNQYAPYAQPIHVTIFGNQLRDEDGMVLGVKDDYGDWVSPVMHSFGLKSVLKVRQD